MLCQSNVCQTFGIISSKSCIQEGKNNQKCKEAFKEMAETGKDILIQERRGTKAVTTVTDDNEKRRNYRILIPYM